MFIYRFLDVEDIITANGGRIVELSNPKLTHILVDKRDIGRRKELMRMTAKCTIFFVGLHLLIVS